MWINFVDLAYEECPLCVVLVTQEYKMVFFFNYVWAECTESFFSSDWRFVMSSFFNNKAVVTKP